MCGESAIKFGRGFGSLKRQFWIILKKEMDFTLMQGVVSLIENIFIGFVTNNLQIGRFKKGGIFVGLYLEV